MALFQTISTIPTVPSCGFNTCDRCALTDYDFYGILRDRDAFINYLVQHGVLSCHVICEKCSSKLTLKTGSRLQYACRRVTKVHKRHRECTFRKSAVSGTFFDNSKVPIEKVGLLVSIYLSRNTSRVRYTVRETGLTVATVVDWFSFIREVLMYWMHKQSAKIGGPGKIVEIDEAKFGKRKYHRGRLLTGQWILGGIERLEGGGADKQKMFLIPVPDRTSQTLVAIIKEYVLPGTTIMTDCWASYNSLAENDYLHLTVNHQINFVDPASGAHTQNIERSWVEVRRYVPRSGLVRQHLASYLADSYFRRANPDHRLRRHLFWQAVAELYPSFDHTLQ